MEIDKKLEIKIINKFIPMTKLFEQLGIDYSTHSNMFCPFHHNENTPSAHYHTDSNLLWCYSEQKMYGSWNLMKQYFPQQDTTKLAINLIKTLGMEKIENELGEVETENTIPYIKSLEKFKER